MPERKISHGHEDRQWDIRINFQSDEYRDDVTNRIREQQLLGRFKYILIGGFEIGTRPYQNDYGVRHVHIAVIFNNRASKASIIKNWGIIEGNGYYMVPRNRELPYSGWRAHHVKEFSKIDPTQLVVFEAGELPKDVHDKRTTQRSELEKKETSDTVIKNIRQLLQDGKDEEAFQKYPRNFVIYGERIKTLLRQKLQSSGTDLRNPHIWVYGFPGTGKTAILSYIYPDRYKKNIDNKYFDLYDAKVHSHVLLEDFDHACVDKLGIQFVKTLCDEAGFPIDQKYKTPQLIRTTVLVTSNFTIEDVVPQGAGVAETKVALFRRFMHVRIDDFLRLLGIKLIPSYERKVLKSQGNELPGALFMSWDYVQGIPTGVPLSSPEYYAGVIRRYIYS